MSTIQLYLKDFSAYLLKPRKATSTSLPITITSKKTNKTKLPKFSQRKIPQTLSFFLFLLSVSHYKRVSSNINKINNKETTTKKGRPFWVLERHNENDPISERWKHALSAIKTSPQKRLILHTHIPSFILLCQTPQIEKRIKPQTVVPPQDDMDIHFLIHWTFTLASFSQPLQRKKKGVRIFLLKILAFSLSNRRSPLFMPKGDVGVFYFWLKFC